MGVKMGHMYRVTNTDTRKGQARNYNTVKVENCDGGDQRWLMFTDNQMAKFAIYDVCKQIKPEKYGRLHKFVRKDGVCKLLVSLIIGGAQKVVLLSQSLVERAFARAVKNGQDIPKQSWFRDLVD